MKPTCINSASRGRQAQGRRVAGSATTLGDWFVNRFVVDRQPLLILVSSASLLPILEPARGVRQLPGRLSSIVRRRLTELGIDEASISAELAAMDPVVVAPTNDPSVLGTMVDFVRCVRHWAPPGLLWDREALSFVEERLERTPCRVSHGQREAIFPADRARELLAG